MSTVRSVSESRYPLAGLVASRAVDRQGAELELATQRSRLHEREVQYRAAELALAAALKQRNAELTADARARTGAELARAGALAAERALTARALEQELNRAGAALKEQTRALRVAELNWQAACVDHTVADRHHERFVAQEQLAAQRADQDESDDLAASRRQH